VVITKERGGEGKGERGRGQEGGRGKGRGEKRAGDSPHMTCLHDARGQGQTA